MFRLRRSRWRRALVAAFAPYLFLSMFVDFVHVHPLVGLDVHASTHEATLSPHGGTTPDRSCPVCQWLRADTGLQTPIGSALTADLIATEFVVCAVDRPVQTVVFAHDLRGPPLRLFV